MIYLKIRLQKYYLWMLARLFNLTPPNLTRVTGWSVHPRDHSGMPESIRVAICAIVRTLSHKY